MQITINIPDNLPQAAIQQQVHAFEEKLKQQAKEVIPATQNDKEKRYQAIIGIAKKCSSLPTIDHRSPDAILGYK